MRKAALAEVQTQDVARIFPGPVLLLAGPGTGKTYQLARRVKWLLEERAVSPGQMVVITFTDPAARNMRERLSDPERQEVYLPVESQPQRISTMHSFAFEIIRGNYEMLGFKDTPRLVPEYLVATLMEDAAQLVGLARDVGNKKTAPCRRKGRCEPAEAKEECKVCARYCEILRSENALDYDDQMFLACKVLRENDEIAGTYRETAVHLLVDEYQDINAAQFEFIRLLAGKDASGLYAVGDDNQSIYSWRGGTPEYIRRFDEHWQNATLARLEESHRCPQAVLDTAAAVIERGCSCFSNNPRIKSKSKAEGVVKVHGLASENAEASYIADTIFRVRGTRDALVLIPRGQYAPPIKRALRERGVSYDCRTQVEESGLHALNELVRWLKDQKDDFAFRECLQRMISNPDLELGQPEKSKRPAWQEEVLRGISQLWHAVEKRGSPLFAALQRANNVSVLKPLVARVRELRAAAGDAPQDFLAVATRMLKPWRDNDECSAEVTEWVDDCRSRNRAAGRPAARVLTMPSAKGLQADMVFVVGLEKGSFPYPSARGEHLEEQYRLLYVSMTRAKQELHLCFARKRSGSVSYRQQAESQGYDPPEPAELLSWLPKGSVQRQDHWTREKRSKPRGPRRTRQRSARSHKGKS